MFKRVGCREFSALGYFGELVMRTATIEGGPSRERYFLSVVALLEEQARSVPNGW